jgi:superfamily II DNA or RNA helicase
VGLKMTKEITPVWEDFTNRKLSFNDLPASWKNLDFKTFNPEKGKRLYDFQVKALKQGLTFLYRFEELRRDSSDYEEAKEKFFGELNSFSNIDLEDKDFRIRKKDLGEAFHYFEERYPIQHRTWRSSDIYEVGFQSLVNRMGYWMATGSGKTLVAVKMIELMNELMEKGEIPERDILILTQNNIVEQFKDEIEDYNDFHETQIVTHSLDDLARVKKGGMLPNSGIDVFIDRSDLITDETKDKQLGFEDIENAGEWYLFLDEAHKGNTSQSKRQGYFSMLARKGFLFNFSATFTDNIDIATTAYNFNIERFTKQGYGKNTLLSQETLEDFTEDEFSEEEKRKTVLKSLIALTSQKKAREKLDQPYHDPLLTCLANSVNIEDSDLEMFFRELERVATEDSNELFLEAKQEIKSSLKERDSYSFSDETVEWTDIVDITKQDVLEHVFNAESHSQIEAKYTPGNRKEIAFSLKSSSEPFALAKIGDISDWLNEKLQGYNIDEEFDETSSYFDNLNSKESSINVLLGSRSFYEGWDSNRPNIMMFINLGTSSNNRKFVTQAIGRGLRIEPFENKRQRLKFLPEEMPEDKIPEVKTIETLLIFGTSLENLKEIIEAVKYVKDTDYRDVEGIEKNSESDDRELLVPTYKEKKIKSIDDLSKFEGNQEEIERLKGWLGDESKLLALVDNLSEEKLFRILKFIESGEFEDSDSDPISDLIRLKSHVDSYKRERSGFADLGSRIIHFQNIEANLEQEEDYEELGNKISEVKSSKDPEEVKEEYLQQKESGELSEEKYADKLMNLKDHNPQKLKYDKYNLEIEKFQNHFYNPVLQSEENENYFRNIVDVKSEIEFLSDLAESIEDEHLFEESDWWMFSKISENTDDVYIPYNNDRKFQPDFIFWIKSDDKLEIVFLDPKSGEFTDYQDKIDGYEETFCKDGSPQVFELGSVKVGIKVKMYTQKDLDKVSGRKYRDYWINDVSEMNRLVE